MIGSWARLLDEADASEWNDLEIAANLLWKCCMADGKYNKFHIGFLTAISYLNDQRGTFSGQEQAFKDLLGIMNQGGPLEAIMKWMETHYTS